MIKIRPKQIIRTCIACPSQWEGQLDDGKVFYGRYRWGDLSLSVSKDSLPPVDPYEEFPTNALDDDAEYIIDETFGDGFDGYMSNEEFMLILHKKKLLNASLYELLKIKLNVLYDRLYYKLGLYKTPLARIKKHWLD